VVTAITRKEQKVMTEKVYKLYMLRPGEAWYQLSPEEQGELLEKIKGNMEELGIKTIISCDSSWSSEQWHFFGLHECPDIEAVQAHAAFQKEIGWHRYGEAKTLLGSALPL
jgi:hypothetical protein